MTVATRMRYYNNEHKQDFLNEMKYEYESLRPFKLIFSRSLEYEKKWGLDIYDFNDSQALEFLKSFGFSTKNSALVTVSMLKKYVRYSSNLSASNVSGFHDITKISSKIDNVVVLYKTLYFTREELLEFIENNTDEREALLLLCFFEGVQGQTNLEIRNMRIEDFYTENGVNYLKVYNGEDRETAETRIVKVSDELVGYAKKYNKITNVKSILPKTGNVYIRELKDTGFVLRSVDKEVTGEGKVDNSLIYRIINNLKRESKESRLKPKDIRNSGIGEELTRIIEEEEIDIDEEGRFRIPLSKVSKNYELGDTTVNLLRIVQNEAFERKFGKFSVTLARK